MSPHKQGKLNTGLSVDLRGGGFKTYVIAFFIGICIPIIIVSSVISTLRGVQIEAGRWVKESLEKKLAIASAKKHRKLIILSGSNGLFGFSARHIEEKYGIPAVNLALHGGLGRQYMFYYTKKVINEGDVVVLPFEYELYQKEQYGYAKVYQIIAHDKDFFNSITLKEKIKFITGVNLLDWIRLIKAKFIPDNPKAGEYDSKTLNSWGDETNNKKENVKKELIQEFLRKTSDKYEIDETAINDIIDFKNAVRKKGGIVVVAYPNILKNCLDIEKNAIFLRDLKEKLEKNNIMVIGDPIAATFDIESVFDTPNHQNEIGQMLSTERLIRDLDSNKILQRLQ